ncbi:MAG: hypothetical protein IPK16_27450 [Anaerolineales bacterium]|nr:hypothetical protein [Anaerolineales bacterium]
MQTITLAPPNFLALHRAEQALARPDVRLDDLVAVFTNSDASGGLLLYNAPQAPPLPAELLDSGWSATVLAAVQPGDYTRFDGPVLTLAAIDALLDDVPSHGTYFFSLDRLNLFGRDSIDPRMRATIGNLIRTIWERWRTLPEAEREAQAALCGKRIVQLSLPLALQQHHETDLVALRFDLSRLATLTDVEQLAQPVFNRPGDDANDIQSLAALGDHEWVAGFKEIPLLVPELNRHRARLLLFRPALRRFTTGARMRATCTGMAYRCWHAWQQTDEQYFQEAAYCLAAEAWLEGQDVTDVVAILPDEDFEIFADQGVARAVSRGSTTQIQSLTDHVSLESVLQSNTAVPRGPVLAIPVLARALCQRGAGVVFDLGPILWQAERAEDLARTFWLLSRDLLIPPGPLWLQLEATPGEIADLAQRAALIYGLSNPWGWRQGRYSLLVSECYAHLDRCLERLAAAAQGTPLAFYYAALRAWYGCPFSEEIQSNLARAVEYGRTFMLMCEDSGISGDLAHEVTIAANLIEAADRLATQDGQTAPMESQFASVAEMLRGLAKHGDPVPIPSQMFGYWSDALMEADREWQRLQSTATEQRPNSARLDELQEKLDKWQRRAFAPYHELQALLTGLRTKSEQVRRLQQAVGDQPVIRIVLRTTEVELGSSQTIAFEIHNNGNQTASSFVWSLRRFSGFDLVSPLPTPQPIEIGPGERRLFDMQARASAPALVLVFSYRYRDKAGRLFTGEDQTTLHARNEPLGVRMRINPFEVGRPVAGASFFNRTTEINRILTRLAKGNTHPLVLRGPRRIGKSSLMRRIVELLHQPADAKAYGLPSELQAALHNLHPIEASLQTMDRSLPRPFEAFLNGILEDMCRNLAIDDTPITAAFHRAANQSGLQRVYRTGGYPLGLKTKRAYGRAPG